MESNSVHVLTIVKRVRRAVEHAFAAMIVHVDFHAQRFKFGRKIVCCKRKLFFFRKNARLPRLLVAKLVLHGNSADIHAQRTISFDIFAHVFRPQRVIFFFQPAAHAATVVFHVRGRAPRRSEKLYLFVLGKRGFN